ncbi:MAG: bifunctional diaminohydroxyphosphoribosylaminopyrimidine deaminase/5-amino-6-(5-phosphoribosylamino)uracil reductase RibD [Lachnospiraceae bacterium]
METDETYMQQVLELAKKAGGATRPNPLVGAVIVKHNEVIGQGYHEKYGGNHAEVNAIQSAEEAIEGGTLYVNLEPCSHYGKTPPCAAFIIEKKIARVVIGMEDPNPLVAGNGIAQLRAAGIEVVVGVLEEKARQLNEVFIKYIQNKIPFLLYKTAMTLDGKTSTVGGESKWISSTKAREEVGKLRGEYGGIMVGIGTVIADDPYLTCRYPGGKNPVRIIVDSHLRIPLNAKVLDQQQARTILATLSPSQQDEKETKEKRKQLIQKGITIIDTPEYEKEVDLNYLIQKLGELEIDSILLEGGPTLAFSCFQRKLVDKIVVFIAPKIFGGKGGKSAVEGKGIKEIKDAFQLDRMEMKKVGEDICVEAYVKKDSDEKGEDCVYRNC